MWRKKKLPRSPMSVGYICAVFWMKHEDRARLQPSDRAEDGHGYSRGDGERDAAVAAQVDDKMIMKYVSSRSHLFGRHIYLNYAFFSLSRCVCSLRPRSRTHSFVYSDKLLFLLLLLRSSFACARLAVMYLAVMCFYFTFLVDEYFMHEKGEKSKLLF